MNTPRHTTTHPTINTQIYDQASEWLVDFRSGDVDADLRRRFSGWLRSSPDHVRAYLELAAIWNEGPALDAGHELDAEALIAAALAEGNVVGLGNPVGKPAEQSTETPNRLTQPEWIGRTGADGSEVSMQLRSSSRRQRQIAGLLGLAAGVLLTAIGVGLWIYSQRNTYSTQIGEQRLIQLEDGSTVELNSRSRLKVRFSPIARHIELLAGEALFRVAQHSSWPFVVHSDKTSVRALGTAFDVYTRPSGTVVTVVEGKVAVIPESATVAPPSSRTSESTVGSEGNLRGDPVSGSERLNTRGSVLERFLKRPSDSLELTAGEQVTVSDQETVITPQPSVAAATAWTQRRLIFDTTPLANVAEEFNRYNRRPLIIRSAQLRDFRVTGVFSSTDTKALILFLQTRSGVVVREQPDAIIVTQK